MHELSKCFDKGLALHRVLIDFIHQVLDTKHVLERLDAELDDLDCILWSLARQHNRLQELAVLRNLCDTTEDVVDLLLVHLVDRLLLHLTNFLERVFGQS